MSLGNSNRAWVCPYFVRDKKNSTEIVCEGGCLILPDRLTYYQYINRHCADLPGWQSCSLAAALSEYYEREEASDGAQCGQDQTP